MKRKIVIGTDESGMFSIRRLLTGAMLLIALSTYAGNDPCKATTKAGEPCKGRPQKGAQYCFIHNPANHCEAKKKDGQPCKAIKVSGTKFCYHHSTQAK